MIVKLQYNLGKLLIILKAKYQVKEILPKQVILKHLRFLKNTVLFRQKVY